MGTESWEIRPRKRCVAIQSRNLGGCAQLNAHCAHRWHGFRGAGLRGHRARVSVHGAEARGASLQGLGAALQGSLARAMARNTVRVCAESMGIARSFNVAMWSKAVCELTFHGPRSAWLIRTAFSRPCGACMRTQSVAIVHQMGYQNAFAPRTLHLQQCAVLYGPRGRMMLFEVIPDMVVRVPMGKGHQRPSHRSRGSERQALVPLS